VLAPPPPPEKRRREEEQQNPPPQSPKPPPSAEETAAATAAAAAAASAALKERKEEQRRRQRDEEGLHLLTLLLQCAESVNSDDLDEAQRALLEIAELATPFGTSTQRVAAYFAEAMSARLVSSCLGLYAPLPNAASPAASRLVSSRIAAAFQVFNGISPFVKFSHFTANQAIQEAFEREDRVHIVDLDIMQGLQWPGLFHILASRPGGPPRVRLTGLGASMEALEATGKRLSDFAETLGLPFEFFPVAEKAGNLDPEKLGVDTRRREAVAVHWLHHSLYDVTGNDSNTLCLIQRYCTTRTMLSCFHCQMNLQTFHFTNVKSSWHLGIKHQSPMVHWYTSQRTLLIDLTTNRKRWCLGARKVRHYDQLSKLFHDLW
jgi:hypothetical protein